MKLKEITTCGFKNLGKTTINFTNNQITALIAPNNYGKSNFLESLSFSYDFIQSNSKVKKRMMKYYPAIPINKYLAKSNFIFKIIFETNLKNKSNLVQYEFEFEWKKNKQASGSKLIREVLKIKENKANSKYSTLIKRDKQNAYYQASMMARCNTEVKLQSHNLAINKLVNNDNLFFHKILEELHSINFSITNLMEVEPAFGAIQILDDKTSIEDDELRDGHNISKFIFNLKKNRKNLYDLLINSIRDLIPTIETIEPIELDLKKMSNEKEFKNVPFSLPEKVYDLRIKELNNNQATSIKYVSRGTKRIILILANAINASEKNTSLLAFEELENSIHPSLLQKLLMILTGIVPKLKMVITSHSPYLIQYLPINSIYLGIPNIKGLSCFYKIKESKQKSIMRIAADEEATLGDFLFDLMLQDSIDMNFKSDFFEQCECD